MGTRPFAIRRSNSQCFLPGELKSNAYMYLWMLLFDICASKGCVTLLGKPLPCYLVLSAELSWLIISAQSLHTHDNDKDVIFEANNLA